MQAQEKDARLARVAQFVKDRFDQAAIPPPVKNPSFTMAYRWEHTLRVAQHGKRIAEAEGANVDLVIAACLLHDIAYADPGNDGQGGIEHGRIGARISRPILQKIGYTEKETENICYAIAVHVDGRADFDHPETLESEIVSDADNIDRFGAYRIIQWCLGEIPDYDSLIEMLKKRIERLEDYRANSPLETETGRRIFAQQLDRQIAFFDALIDEHALTCLPQI
jgi:putative nucleotidyltransferase with HDIG domain